MLQLLNTKWLLVIQSKAAQVIYTLEYTHHHWSIRLPNLRHASLRVGIYVRLILDWSITYHRLFIRVQAQHKITYKSRPQSNSMQASSQSSCIVKRGLEPRSCRAVFSLRLPLSNETDTRPGLDPRWAVTLHLSQEKWSDVFEAVCKKKKRSEERIINIWFLEELFLKNCSLQFS